MTNKYTIFGKCFIVMFMSLCMISNAQTLKKATGGNGSYKESIWWLDFKDVEIASGQTLTQTYSIDGLYTLIVTIENVSFGGNLVDDTPLSSQRLIGYASGTYGGDGLVTLYNIGVPGGGQTIEQRSQNKLFNAVSMKYDGDYSGDEAIANFRVKAYAYINSSNAPIDVGLVFASAETDDSDSSYSEDWYTEFSQGTTNGSDWQVLETAFLDPEGYQKLTISNSGKTARTIVGFNGYDFQPGNVILTYTNKINTTEASPLSVDMNFQGGGKSATALGILISGIDKGDAPISFMPAENHFFATVINGTSGNGTYYLSPNGVRGGTPIINPGNLTLLQDNLKLGDLSGDHDEFTEIINTTADLDDTTDSNDEDALSKPLPQKAETGTYTLNVPVTNQTGVNAYLYGFIDWNQNGVFDSDEAIEMTVPSQASQQLINLTWANPPMSNEEVVRSFVRLRLTTNKLTDNPYTPMDERSFLKVFGGETEDYYLDWGGKNCTDSGITSVDLNSLLNLSAPLPTDVEVEWWTSPTRDLDPANMGEILTDPSNVTASGTYYAFFHDTANDCYNTDNSTAEVVVNILPPCFCTQDPAPGTPDGFTKVGISTMEKQIAGWPENIGNGFLTMESPTQGFVITRVQHVGGTDGAPAATDAISDPKEGMLVYDIDDDCVKLFNGEIWNCLERTCNE